MEWAKQNRYVARTMRLREEGEERRGERREMRIREEEQERRREEEISKRRMR